MGRVNSFTPKQDVLGRTRDGRGYLVAPAGVPMSELRAMHLGLMPGPSEYKAIVSLEHPQTQVAEIDATDAAKELATKHGIDLSSINGTGKDGRITKRDVEALIPE